MIIFGVSRPGTFIFGVLRPTGPLNPTPILREITFLLPAFQDLSYFLPTFWNSIPFSDNSVSRPRDFMIGHIFADISGFFPSPADISGFPISFRF